MHSGDAARFETDLLLQRMMGPNCVKLAAELLTGIDLSASRRILDLGCGQGLSSIYLSRISPAQIVAYDLWIDPSTNQDCFLRLGLADRILPVHGDVLAMPFGRRTFDAVVCIDAYTYFGADRRFLDAHLAPYLKPGATIAIAVPGLQHEFAGGVPEALQPYWQDDIHFHTLDWWRVLFESAETVTLRRCFSMASQAEAWQDWLQCDNPYAKRDVEMMRAENGEYFDMIGLIATVD